MKIKAKNIRVEIGAIPEKKEEGIAYFESFGELNKILTPKRLELIDVIKLKNPESIYELAKLLKRDQGNVTKDVNILHQKGFLELTKNKEGERTKVQPTFDKGGIEFMIKLGAGAFGIAKDILEDISSEFKEDKLSENKMEIKNKIKKTSNSIADNIKKFADDL